MVRQLGEAERLAPEDESPYVLEEQVGHILRRAHQRASAIFMEWMASNRLTPTQYAALIKIRDLSEVSQNRLGRLIAMDPATIKGVVERLKDRNLVVAQSDPTNRRRLILTLSSDGLALAEEAIPLAREITTATLAPLDKAEQKLFLNLLQRLT